LFVKKNVRQDFYLEVRSLLPGMVCHCGSVESYCFPERGEFRRLFHVKEKEKK